MVQTLDSPPQLESPPGKERVHPDHKGIRGRLPIHRDILVHRDTCQGSSEYNSPASPWCPGEQGELPMQDGKGGPRICGCFHLRGAEGHMWPHYPLAESPWGASPAPGPCGKAQSREGPWMQHPNAVMRDTQCNLWTSPLSWCPLLKHSRGPSPGPSFETFGTKSFS